MEMEEDDAFNQDDLFTQETYEKIVLDKCGQPNKYHSHWECDEEDIEGWSEVDRFNIKFIFFIIFYLF
jgi:hypothetical protein